MNYINYSNLNRKEKFLVKKAFEVELSALHPKINTSRTKFDNNFRFCATKTI